MKQNKSSRSTVLLFFLGAAMIVAALIMLVPDLLNYKQSNDTYEALKDTYVSEKAENTEVAEETEGDDSWWYTDVDVKLEELQQVNADIIGWIRFDNLEQLSYPVLYSGDDEKYLRTDIYGNQTIAGCIFMEGMNTPNFQDYHTILYGHNMKNGSMFAQLHKFEDPDFFDANREVVIYLPGEVLHYTIFAAHIYDDRHLLYSFDFTDPEVYQKYLDSIFSTRDMSANIDKDITVTTDDQIITLVTCIGSQPNNRLLVQAVLTDREPGTETARAAVATE